MLNRHIAFIDIDTQNDFMLPDGALYVKGAEKLIPKIEKAINFAKLNRIKIFSSLDTHMENDPEFKDFPPHCVRGSYGWEKVRGTLLKRHSIITFEEISEIDLDYPQLLFEKNKFSIFSNLNFKKVLSSLDIKSVFVFGVATEYCVKSSALDFVKNGYRTFVIEDLIRGVDEESSKKALDEMKKMGVKFLNLNEVIKKL